MTLGTTISSITDTANGVTTAFAYPFLMPNAADAVISYTPSGGTTVTLSPTQFTISGIGNPAGGTVTYPLAGSPLAAGTVFTITRILALIQPTSVAAQGPTFAAIEQALDQGVMIDQQLQQEINILQLEVASITSSTLSAFSGVGQLASIAALEGYTGPATIPLWIQGYSTAADGGEGMFSPNSGTASANGGTVIIDGSGRVWNRETGGAPYSVKWFGATGLGVADDTTAISNCLAVATSAVYVPEGTYRITSTLNALAPIRFFGDGTSVSIISPSNTINAYISSATGSLSVENISFIYPPSTTGSGVFAVRIAALSDSITASRMSNVVISGAAGGVQVFDAQDFVMDGVFVYNFSNTGTLIASSSNIDITNCGFYGNASSTNSVAVEWIGTGGLRLEGSAINTCQYGLFYAFGGSGVTGKLVVTGNAFAAVETAAVFLGRSGTGSVNSAIISTNAMWGCGGGVTAPHDSGGVWLSSVVIHGNTWTGLGGVSDFAFTVDSVQDFTIQGNAIASATTTTQGIVVGMSASMGVIQGNVLSGSFSSTISVSGTATMIRVLDNQGYNPVGSSTLSPGVSPWTYTASTSPQTLYAAATTSINSVTYKGTSLLPGPTAAGATFTLGLGPNEVVVISYSGSMTASVMTH